MNESNVLNLHTTVWYPTPVFLSSDVCKGVENFYQEWVEAMTGHMHANNCLVPWIWIDVSILDDIDTVVLMKQSNED